MNVRPEEFVSARDAARGFGPLMDRLARGDIEKAIVVYRNQPRAVILTVERFEKDYLPEEEKP